MRKTDNLNIMYCISKLWFPLEKKVDAGGKLEAYSVPLPVFQGLQFGNGCKDITYLIW